MKKYYNVRIKVKKETDSGKIKEYSEIGIVSAETPEDAAYKAREYYGMSMSDYEISDVKETKILFIID